MAQPPAFAPAPPPDSAGPVAVVWRDGAFVWERLPEAGVRSVAVVASNGLIVTGSPIPSGQSGVLRLALTETGVEEGDWFRVTVDRQGRVTAGAPLTAGDVIGALGFTPIAEEIEVYATGGDVWGSGRRDAVLLELSPTGVEYGTYERVVVDRKGRIVQGLPPSTRRPLIRLAGDVAGAGTDEIEVALTDTGVLPGTYGRVVVDSQGRVRQGLLEEPPRPVVLVGEVVGSMVGSVILANLSPTGIEPGTYSKVLLDAQGRARGGLPLDAGDVSRALGFAPLRVVRARGDAAGQTAANGDLSLRLVNSGVAPGTYSRVAVDAKGRVVVGLPPAPSTDTLADVARRGSITDAAVFLRSAAPSAGPAEGGALTVLGGAGIGGDLHVGGVVHSGGIAIGGAAPGLAALRWRGNSAGEIAVVEETGRAEVGLDLARADSFLLVLRGHRVLIDPVGAVPGQSGTLWIEQGDSGGWALAFGSRWRFPGGTAPDLPRAPGSLSALRYAVGPRGEVAVGCVWPDLSSLTAL